VMTAARTERLVHARGVSLLMTQINGGLGTQPVDATHMNSSSVNGRLKETLNVVMMAVPTETMATVKELAIGAIHGTIN